MQNPEGLRVSVRGYMGSSCELATTCDALV